MHFSHGTTRGYGTGNMAAQRPLTAESEGLDSKQDATTGLPQSCEAIFTLPVPVSSPVHGASITYLRGLLQGDRNVRKAPGTWYVVVTQGITIIITVIKLTAGILFSLS